MERIIPDRATEDGANKDQVRCGHGRRGHTVSGVASGDLWRTEEAGKKHEACPQLQPSLGLPGYADRRCRVGGDLLFLLGLIFHMCILEEGSARCIPKSFQP